MAVIRVEHNKNYTVMANYHLKDTTLSLKAKGLMSFMLSLPDNWDYTIEGLATRSTDGKDAIRTAIKELTEHGYMEIKRVRDESGRLHGTEYMVYEMPKRKIPISENPTLENPTLENPTQLNTNVLSTKELNTKKGGKAPARTKFQPPTLEEVKAYVSEKGLQVDADYFYTYFSEGNWVDSRGNKVKNWKQKILTWSRHDNGQKKKDNTVSSWLQSNDSFQCKQVI